MTVMDTSVQIVLGLISCRFRAVLNAIMGVDDLGILVENIKNTVGKVSMS